MPTSTTATALIHNGDRNRVWARSAGARDS
jgi:hypothetical protein